jgi:hypothetical protein
MVYKKLLYDIRIMNKVIYSIIKSHIISCNLSMHDLTSNFI